MKRKRPTAKPLRLYLIDPNTDEVAASFSMNALAIALKTAQTERCQIVIASSLAMAEDIATGTRRGAMFWPSKIHHGSFVTHPTKKRRTTKNRRRTSRR